MEKNIIDFSSSRLENLEYRVSRIETKLQDFQSQKKKHQRTYKIPEGIDKTLFKKLVTVRKELVKKTEKNALNLIFSGEKLSQILRLKCATLTDLTKIKGWGRKNIEAYGNQFLDALKPDPMPDPKIGEPPKLEEEITIEEPAPEPAKLIEPVCNPLILKSLKKKSKFSK